MALTLHDNRLAFGAMRQRLTNAPARVLATMGRDLQAYCSSIGTEIGPFAKTAGIDLEVLRDFEAQIDFDAFCRLLEMLAVASKREAFGIEYADYFRLGGSGSVGQGMSAAPDIEEAYRFLTGYIGIIADHRFFEATYEHDAITIEWSYSPLLSRTTQYVGFSIRLIVNTLNAITNGRQRYKQFCFTHDSPDNSKQYQIAFPATLEFGQDTNRVVLAADLLEVENPNSDPVVFEYMRQACEKARERWHLDKPLNVVLREDIIERLPTGGLSIDAASHIHGMSVRTLQRRLSELGLVYESLVDDVRASMIETLLMNPRKKPMSQIAEAVGYSDQSSFSRAVVKRFSKTPTQLRAELLGKS